MNAATQRAQARMLAHLNAARVRRRVPGRRGMGLYPNQPCYDPSRPDWLPYWLDDLSESGCKFGAYPGVTTLAAIPTPPAGAAPGAPQTADQMTVPGDYTPAQSATDAAAAYQQSVSNFFNNLANSGDFGGNAGCDTTAQSWIDPSSWCTPRWLGMGAVVIVGVAIFLGRKR